MASIFVRAALLATGLSLPPLAFSAQEGLALVASWADKSTFGQDYRAIEKSLSACSVKDRNEFPPGAISMAFDCPASSGLSRVSVYSVSAEGESFMMVLEATLREGRNMKLRDALLKKLGKPAREKGGYVRWVLPKEEVPWTHGTPIISIRRMGKGETLFQLGFEQGP